MYYCIQFWGLNSKRGVTCTQCLLQRYLQQPGYRSNLGPLTDEWIKKLWYMDRMKCYSRTRGIEIGSFVEMCMDPESVIQSKVCAGDLRELLRVPLKRH